MKLLTPLAAGARASMRGLAWFARQLFGRWDWQAPRWIVWVSAQARRAGRHLAANPLRASALAVAVVAGSGAYIWYANRPKPHYVTFKAHSPELTRYTDDGVIHVDVMKIQFSESAAPLKQLQKTVTGGIEISPPWPAPGHGTTTGNSGLHRRTIGQSMVRSRCDSPGRVWSPTRSSSRITR